MFSSFRVSSATCLLSLSLLFSTPFTTKNAASQSSPTYNAVSQSVSVTPDAGMAAERTANTGGHVLTFTVTNTGTATDTYDLSCVGVARAACGGTSRARLTLNAGQEATVDVSYAVTDAGTGLVSLIAFSPVTRARDRGAYLVPVAQ